MSETCTSLLDPFLREERLAAVTAPHVAALNRWVSGLRQHGVELPWFDPADGRTARPAAVAGAQQPVTPVCVAG
ncbi:hypothetical protein [Pantoea ananatis]|uniref:hypothetical protein n=1 Tax=Pantoea ananas TaxID=553 RepID=UPI000301661A|nr:hypothetical protein [Pantoea ananatis]